jgi:acyl-CoA synthetase (AMP-forming)/AMP-acid ligase II
MSAPTTERAAVVSRPDGSRGYAGARHATLAQMLAATASERGDGTAFVDERRSITWAGTLRQVEELAGRLAARGVRAGDRVALLFGNGIPYVVAAWATWRVGAIVVPVNARLLPDEMVPLVRDADVALLLAGAGFRDEAEHLARASWPARTGPPSGRSPRTPRRSPRSCTPRARRATPRASS